MVVRQFSRFLLRLGYSAYVPDFTLASREQSSFVPRILTHEEIRKLLQAVDALEPTARSPLRHLIMPEVFRLLYGCGFRLGEVLHLRVADVDLNQGILTVRKGKFGKCCAQHLQPYVFAKLMLRRLARSLGARSVAAVGRQHNLCPMNCQSALRKPIMPGSVCQGLVFTSLGRSQRASAFAFISKSTSA